MSSASHADSHGRHHAHHFESAEHEYESSKFGTWTFLLTEMLMFGGLFVGYILFHEKYPEMYHAASQFLDWKMGSLNTVVLLLSSLTMALSIHYAQQNDKSKTLINLYVTLICAGIFMVVKYFEYVHKFEIGLGPTPGLWLKPTSSHHHDEFKLVEDLVKAYPDLKQYFGFYFCMTALHGSHVLIGMGLIVWCIVRTHKGEFNSEYWTPLECVGLFWHLVDLIWIYLFPLLYLIG